MRMKKALIPILTIINLIVSACIYIVLPEGLDMHVVNATKDWSAVVTEVSQTPTGDLHIGLTIRNSTGDWSSMKVVDGKPAILTTKDGKTHNCETVYVGTGGHRLAPGFQMRGYTVGTKAKPETQLLFVECKGIQSGAESKLAIDYVAYNGELDYYHQEEGESTGTMEVNLDDIAVNLTYPVFENIDGLVEKPDASITALSNCVISLLDVQRTDDGFEFKWQNSNPTEFALKIHIGNPPVIGSDGIIYGYYQIMDIVSAPLAPAGGKVEWTTKVIASPDASGYYILLSVESKNMRLYVNHLIDITDK